MNLLKLFSQITLKNDYIVNFDRSIFKQKLSTDLVVDSLKVHLEICENSDPDLKKIKVVILSDRDGNESCFLTESNEAFSSSYTAAEWQERFKHLSTQSLRLSTQCLLEKVRQEIASANELIAMEKADAIFPRMFSKLGSLEEEMKRAGLSLEAIELIKKHAKSVSLANDFLKKGTLDPQTVILGLNHKKIIDSLAYLNTCQTYVDAYLRFYGSVCEAKVDFTEKLTQQNQPLVFLVPRKLFGRNGVTRKEVEWLLAHPQAMKNIDFVFGIYTIYSKKDILPRIRSFADMLAERLLSQAMSPQPLPPVKTPDIQLLYERRDILISRLKDLSIPN